MSLLSSCRDTQLEALQAQKTTAEATVGLQEAELKQVKAELVTIHQAGLETKLRSLEERLVQAQQALKAEEAKLKLPRLLEEKALAASWRTQFDASQFSTLFGAIPAASVDGIQAPSLDQWYARRVTLTVGDKSVSFTATANAAGKWQIPDAEAIAKSLQSQPSAIAGVKVAGDAGATFTNLPQNSSPLVDGPRTPGISVTPSPQLPPGPPQKSSDPPDSDDSGGHGKRGGREGLSPPKPSPQR